MKKLNLETYYKLLKQGKDNLILLEFDDKIIVTNKKTGNTYQITKTHYKKNKAKYDVVKPQGINKVKKQDNSSNTLTLKSLVDQPSKMVELDKDSGRKYPLLEPSDETTLNLGNYARADAKTRKQYRDHLKRKYSDLYYYGEHIGQGGGSVKDGYTYNLYKITKPNEKPKVVAVKYDLNDEGNGNELHALNMILRDRAMAKERPSSKGKNLGKMPEDINSKEADEYIKKKYGHWVGSEYKGVNKNGEHLFYLYTSGGGQTLRVKDPKEAEILKKYSDIQDEKSRKNGYFLPKSSKGEKLGSEQSKKEVKVPDDPYSSHEIVPDAKSAVKAVENVMIQYGGGGGQEGWDEVWEKHKKQVETLLDKMLKKTNLTYHDLGNLGLPTGEYPTLESGQKSPPEFKKLQKLMDKIADQAQDNFMNKYANEGFQDYTEEDYKKDIAYNQYLKPLNDEYWAKVKEIQRSSLPYEEKNKKFQELNKWHQEEFKKWASNWDWKTGKPKTESKQPKKSVFQSITEKRKRINNKYFKLEQTIWSDKSLTQEQREKKISQLRRLKNKELEQL